MYKLTKNCIKRLYFKGEKYRRSESITNSFRDTVRVNENSVKVKKFEEIPGPRTYPVIGTLYKYFPFIGM